MKRLLCTCVKLAKTSVDSRICHSFSTEDYHWQGKNITIIHIKCNKFITFYVNLKFLINKKWILYTTPLLNKSHVKKSKHIKSANSPHQNNDLKEAVFSGKHQGSVKTENVLWLLYSLCLKIHDLNAKFYESWEIIITGLQRK